jgi:hypothetical protein
MTVDSGDLNSQRFTVTFTSNAASAAGDSVRVLYTTAGCGNSARKSAKLSNTLLSAPAAPATLVIATKSDVCNARTYRYIAPAVLPGATATAGAANGYLWSTPTGTVGSPGTIDSDYRGEIGVILYNASDIMYTVNPLHKIAQLVFAPVSFSTSFLGLDVVRGDSGFGSTGD